MKNSIIYLIILFIFSCKSGINRTTSNNRINTITFETLNSIEKDFLEDIKSKKFSKAQTVMSKLLLDLTEEQLNYFLGQIATSLENNETSILDQYHIQGSSGSQQNTLFSSLDSLNGYTFFVKPKNKEAFLSLRIIHSEPIQLLLTSLYTKYNESWKLDMIKISEYSILNKNAQQLHLEAQNEYENENLLNAANLILLSSQISNPSGNNFTYKNTSEIEKSFIKIIKELKSKYKFPIPLNNIRTKPQIVDFSREVVAEGIIPTIAYQTTIPISDTIKLRKENIEIHNEIESVLKNIKSNNKFIIYKAMNAIPNKDSSIDTYNFVQKNTEDNNI